MWAAPSLDVVIPVYNAPALTRRCIDSVITFLGESIGNLYVQDDASGAETREMLDQLPYERVHVYHAQTNRGFGASVNEAIKHSDASYVLVLNSDTTVNQNFLPLLCAALAADPQLAVVIPGGNDYARYDMDQYLRRPGGYIATYRLQGHAFLVRREVFQEAGGFDSAYGRGYYEDLDLGRRFVQRGFRLGVHPDARIQHKGGGSFGRGRSFRQLVRGNRTLYFSRYPEARRNILLLSGNIPLVRFPTAIVDALEDVFRKGGYVHWLSPEPARQLLCLQMRSHAMSGTIVRLLMRTWREDKHITEVWMLPDVSRLVRAVIVSWARFQSVKVLSWESKTGNSPESV